MPLKPSALIESPRLLIRIVQEADIPGLLPINGDEHVTRWLPYAAWQSLADGHAWFERMRALASTGAALQFVIVERASGGVIGTCLLFRHEEASARAELGYVLGRAHWHQGFMQEALAALIACAFNEYALRRLEAEVDPDNVASNRLLHGLGFVHEGLLRKRWVTKGMACDANIYGLLRDEWSAA
jgi:[ribosomal protein S5]-alanine N-acetyltransferase